MTWFQTTAQLIGKDDEVTKRFENYNYEDPYSRPKKSSVTAWKSLNPAIQQFRNVTRISRMLKGFYKKLELKDMPKFCHAYDPKS